MKTCRALIEKLQQHPELDWNETPGGVRIEATHPNNFAVEMVSSDMEWTVYLGNGGFHEVFNSAEEALNFIAWCYSGSARLRELWRGNSSEKSVLESQENGEWREVSVMGFLFVPIWRKRKEIILQNPKFLTG